MSLSADGRGGCLDLRTDGRLRRNPRGPMMEVRP